VIRSPADLPKALVDENIQRNAIELDRPEIRTTKYVRAKLDKTATPAQEAAARAIAEAIHAELGTEGGLFPHDLEDSARRHAGDHPMEIDASLWQTPREGRSEETFAAALFAIPEIGQISPPIRTPWGWDILLLVDIEPARKRTRDELAADMFPTLRHFFFDKVWAARIVAAHQVERFADRLPDDERPAPGDDEPPPDDPIGGGTP
jgi:hypothetical protein